MNRLAEKLLPLLEENPNVLVPISDMLQLPEKVLQFGTGVLLRGLTDYLIDKANRQGIFNGRIVVVKSTDSGDATAFDEQNNLYTLCVRGIDNGSQIETNTVCSAISRVLSAKTQWQQILECAHNPELQVIVSNTTEVGIQLIQDDIRQSPPVSFPGKLLAFLYERFNAFAGDPAKGMVIVPTELIPNNGKKLESILFELAHRNNLETEFLDWLENSNFCCNSLVDRIVPGKPDEATRQQITQQLGYTDELITMSEVYRLWAIEGNEHIRSVLSFHQADEGVIIEPNIELFRELKLRMLNGTHTLSCGLAYLSGITTVKEAMSDENMSAFISNLMLGEIGTSIPYSISEKAIQRFGMQVLDRFRNPFIEHRWINITMEYTSKMIMRDIPVLLQYYKNFGTPPPYISLGFAAYLLFTKPVKEENDTYFGQAHGTFYPIKDSHASYFFEAWKNVSSEQLVTTVLKNTNMWETDLTALPGFADKVTDYLIQMQEKGVREVLFSFFPKNVLTSQ
ncbi:tagaturonate reductase [Cytophagaceae bacterium DM2B3-1]|uniref:Tagaturonate reductase n=1 Tax=Xanthocytophaga flava TaxID=3048013 RepID=A0ABT7CPA3_9BACT|nr:tagaturonate reductase [Xanthocytophaga flavus]MDJ1495568.1 tagaturonate reductase [Xanthocytophaga flavus]